MIEEGYVEHIFSFLIEEGYFSRALAYLGRFYKKRGDYRERSHLQHRPADASPLWSTWSDVRRGVCYEPPLTVFESDQGSQIGLAP